MIEAPKASPNVYWRSDPDSNASRMIDVLMLLSCSLSGTFGCLKKLFPGVRAEGTLLSFW